MKTKFFLFVILTIFLESCDNHKTGADPVKNGKGYCFWYYDKEDEFYCAYDKKFPPTNIDLIYQKCTSCEEFMKSLDQQSKNQTSSHKPRLKQ